MGRDRSIGRRGLMGAVAAGAALAAAPARAETSELKLANQYSLAHLPLMVAKDQGLIEKELNARGLGGVTLTWLSLAGSSAMIDGLLSGGLHLASTGTSGFAILWDRTRGEVKALCAEAEVPMWLVTRDASVKSLTDLSDRNRIALPAVGTSPQATTLQMAAMKLFGREGIHRFDKLTVTMSHPDAYAAMLSGASGIDGHFGAPPFSQWELDRIPGSRVILNGDDLMGGPTTSTVAMTTQTFRRDNPKSFAALLAGLRAASDFINAQPRRAAEIYLAALKNRKDTVEETVKTITSPGTVFSYVPRNTAHLFASLNDIGVLKRRPGSWKDLFFDDLHAEAGS